MFFAPPRASLVILIIYAAVPPTYSLTVRTSTSNLNATHDRKLTAFRPAGHHLMGRPQSPPYMTSLRLAPEITLSSHQLESPTSMLMGPSGIYTQMLRIKPTSGSLVISLSLSPTLNRGCISKAARPSSRSRLLLLLRLLIRMPPRPPNTFWNPRVPGPYSKPGSATTTRLAMQPSCLPSRRSVAIISWDTPTTVAASSMAPFAWSVRRSSNREIIIRSLMNILARSQSFWSRAPLPRLLEAIHSYPGQRDNQQCIQLPN